MAKKANKISLEIQSKIKEKVDAFNQKHLTKVRAKYTPRISGKFIYLDRMVTAGNGKICRLIFDGDLENMDFAIYKYSTETYDPKCWLFPGQTYVDGTLEGAMQAGLEAYPIKDENWITLKLFRILTKFFLKNYIK